MLPRIIVEQINAGWHLWYSLPKNISQTFRLKAIGKARNYLFEKIEQNELMSRKRKKDSTT